MPATDFQRQDHLRQFHRAGGASHTLQNDIHVSPNGVTLVWPAAVRPATLWTPLFSHAVPPHAADTRARTRYFSMIYE